MSAIDESAARVYKHRKPGGPARVYLPKSHHYSRSIVCPRAPHIMQMTFELCGARSLQLRVCKHNFSNVIKKHLFRSSLLRIACLTGTIDRQADLYMLQYIYR